MRQLNIIHPRFRNSKWVTAFVNSTELYDFAADVAHCAKKQSGMDWWVTNVANNIVYLTDEYGQLKCSLNYKAHTGEYILHQPSVRLKQKGDVHDIVSTKLSYVIKTVRPFITTINATVCNRPLDWLKTALPKLREDISPAWCTETAVDTAAIAILLKVAKGELPVARVDAGIHAYLASIEGDVASNIAIRDQANGAWKDIFGAPKWMVTHNPLTNLYTVGGWNIDPNGINHSEVYPTQMYGTTEQMKEQMPEHMYTDLVVNTNMVRSVAYKRWGDELWDYSPDAANGVALPIRREARYGGDSHGCAISDMGYAYVCRNHLRGGYTFFCDRGV